jgi:hypothetical protein
MQEALAPENLTNMNFSNGVDGKNEKHLMAEKNKKKINCSTIA